MGIKIGIVCMTCGADLYAEVIRDQIRVRPCSCCMIEAERMGYRKGVMMLVISPEAFSPKEGG